jgi:hypothetical protein
VPGHPFIGSEVEQDGRTGRESGCRTVWRWWWPSGAITLAVLALNEGEGKRQGWRPLHGGEGADREAAGRGSASALGREVAGGAGRAKAKA